jgi:hypothetical protein
MTFGLRKWCLPPGRPGDRFTLAELERASKVSAKRWSKWVARGLMTAAQPVPGGPYLVRRRALRKALRVPEIAQAIVDAEAKGAV